MAAQRFVLDAAARGRQRQRDGRSAAPVAAQLVPNDVASASEDFHHPDAILGDHFDTGDAVRVTVDKKLAVSERGAPVRTNWQIVAFSRGREDERRAALAEEYRRREEKLARLKAARLAARTADDAGKGAKMRTVLSSQLLQLDKMDLVMDRTWTDMNRSGLMDQWIRQPRDQERCKRCLRDRYLQLAELFKFYGAAAARATNVFGRAGFERFGRATRYRSAAARSDRAPSFRRRVRGHLGREPHGVRGVLRVLPGPRRLRGRELHARQ